MFASTGHVIPLAAAPNGDVLLVSRWDAGTGLDVWAVQTSDGEAQPIIETAFDETGASISPDGRYVTYQSNESGRWQIYVMRLADGRRVVVSPAGGVEPSWLPEDHRVQYRTGTKTMMASIDEQLRVSAPVETPLRRAAAPVAIDGGGRLRLENGSPPLERAIVTLSFDRELRERLGPLTGPMPR